MTATARHRLVGTALLLTTALTAACGGGDTPPPAPPTTVTVTRDPVEPDRPEQQEIDASTARRALPTLDDMPDRTWHVDTSVFGTHRSVYEPAACASVEFDSADVRRFVADHRTVDESARFSQDQADGGLIIAAYVASYDEPYPLSFFDDAGEQVSGCTDYTRSRNVGETRSSARAITVPQLGDRSFGVRLQSLDYDHSVDRLYVRSGHNVITVMVLSREDSYDGKLMTEYAQGVLDDLEKAT